MITTLIALFFVMMVGSAILSLTMQGLRVTQRVKKGTLAFNMAESGLERAARWLKDQGSPPSGTATIYPFGAGAQTLGNGTYTVSVVPDAGNAGAVLKKYTLVSNGTFASHTVRVDLVMRQQSFGKFAYFTDSETSSISGGRIWFYSGDRIRGPAHSNNAGGSDFQINWGGGTGPIFEGQVTSAASEIDYAPEAPDTASEFAQIFKDGANGYQLGVDGIPLPSSSDMQKVAGWGSSSGFPSTDGVYTPATGGVYVRGNSSMVMQLDGSGNQQFVITQGSTTTTVTIDLVNNRRGKKVGSGSTVWTSGAGTGVVYSTGDITSLSGTLADNLMSGSTITARSSLTIATDVNAGKNINLAGSISQNTDYDPDLPMSDINNLKAGTLGLIGRNVKVKTGAPQNMEIDAVILAGSSSTSDGSFYVEDYASKQPTGTLKVMGGIIQKNRGPVGTLRNGALYTGYSKDYWYDARLADTPPPYFPTTGGYDRMSWQRKQN